MPDLACQAENDSSNIDTNIPTYIFIFLKGSTPSMTPPTNGGLVGQPNNKHAR